MKIKTILFYKNNKSLKIVKNLDKVKMSEYNELGILTCPLCGSNFCQIFYGFSLIYPNFDNPKRLNIELNIFAQ